MNHEFWSGVKKILSALFPLVFLFGLFAVVLSPIFYNSLIKEPQLTDELEGRMFEVDSPHPSIVVIVEVTEIKGVLGFYTYAEVDVDLYVERPENMTYLGTSEGSTVLNWQTENGGGESWRYDVVLEDIETDHAGEIDLYVVSVRNVWVVDDINSVDNNQ